MWFEKGKIYRENRRGLAALTSGNMVTPVLRKKSVSDEFVNKNLRETLDCSH
jgi:hypothetical protein